jgi:hypothetical protein
VEYLYNNLPSQEDIESINISGKIHKVNGHIHTPWSFSAFRDVEQAFSMAVDEDVKVLGINDFYNTDGYQEFAELAIANKIFPLFNIEFMALSEEGQKQGIRYNDPGNPGRIYFSGKGLRYPVQVDPETKNKFDKLEKESNKQTAMMVEKLNEWLKAIDAGFSFSFEDIKEKYARNLVRERHIATAVRIKIMDRFQGSDIAGFFEKLFDGKALQSNMSDFAAVENEIRNNLLKAGGKAFVPEDPKAFLSLGEVKEIILASGGIPCYPLLQDDAHGNFTDFEGDKEALLKNLKEMGVGCVEMIPGRNDLQILKEYVEFFDKNGVVVTFGTEHNTPKLDPLTVSCRGGVALDDELMHIGYKGACVIAAHQYLVSKGETGFVNTDGTPNTDDKTKLEELGDKVINEWQSGRVAKL